MKKIPMNLSLSKIMPPDKWKRPVFVLVGIIIGLGFYLLKVSNAVSYLSDNSETCINCHVMNPQYASWQHSSHKSVTNCNDCHVPHTNVVSKYYFKAKDGLRHAAIFSLRLEPQVIKIKEAGMVVVQENCIRCHNYQNENVSTLVSFLDAEHGEGKLCWDCHRETPHGRVNSLTSTPNARTPKLGSPVPDWMKK